MLSATFDYVHSLSQLPNLACDNLKRFPMLSFTYESLPSRVIFGAGSLAQLPAEATRLGVSKAFVLSTAEQRETAEHAVRLLGTRAVGVFTGAVMHVPVEVAAAATSTARELGADCCVAVGGGSTTGLAKAIALNTGLPIIAIPTSYAGSEMTPIWGLTESGVKKTGRNTRVLPRTVIYDPQLTVSMPPLLSAASGMNSIAHCVEALYAQDANPVISLLAEEGIRQMAGGLPKVVAEPGDLIARSRALYGAWLGGVALGAVGMALHHKLCHTLGGSFNLPHAETHTIILPHACAYNTVAAPEAIARATLALRVNSAAAGLFDLAASLGTPTSLAALGMKHSDLDKAADLAVQNPYYNPRPIERGGIRALLQDAFEGRRPE
jgi:alcohol dehydrogenase class IV